MISPSPRYPAWQPTHHKRGACPKRTGSVLLMLVFALTILVGTFSLSLSGRAVQQRRAESHHQSMASLESAIDAVDQSSFSDKTKLRLPLDETGGRWIVVEVISQESDPHRRYRATQFKNDHPGLSIERDMKSSHDESS